jgi:hypothetical protein
MDQKLHACRCLKNSGWDGTTRNLPLDCLKSVATEFGISPERAEPTLGRQLKAAIVRNRKEKWAQEWRTAWASVQAQPSLTIVG